MDLINQVRQSHASSNAATLLGIGALALLIVLLGVKELLQAHGGSETRRVARVISIPIVPLALVVTALAVLRLGATQPMEAQQPVYPPAPVVRGVPSLQVVIRPSTIPPQGTAHIAIMFTPRTLIHLTVSYDGVQVASFFDTTGPTGQLMLDLQAPKQRGISNGPSVLRIVVQALGHQGTRQVEGAVHVAARQ